MSNPLARLSAWFGGLDVARRRAILGVAVTFVTMIVFCVLIVTVSIWKAFVFAGLALFTFGVVESLLPESWRVGRRPGAGAEQEAAAGTPRARARARARRLGLADAAIDALPTFAYAPGGGEGDLESGSGELCSVCLEDLQAGEMVRQLPTCKHLFHAECIDMWLHTHRTCPLCRCDLSPPRSIAAKVEEVEMEEPAVDPVPPV